MLYQNVIDHAAAFPITRGSSIPSLLDGAARFVLDDRATEAMVRLALMRPSNIIESAKFIRLPAETVWVEYLDPVRKRIWEDSGLRIDDKTIHPTRNGFLLTNGPQGQLLFSSFWNVKGHKSPFETSLFMGAVDLDFSALELRSLPARAREIGIDFNERLSAVSPLRPRWAGLKSSSRLRKGIGGLSN